MEKIIPLDFYNDINEIKHDFTQKQINEHIKIYDLSLVYEDNDRLRNIKQPDNLSADEYKFYLLLIQIRIKFLYPESYGNLIEFCNKCNTTKEEWNNLLKCIHKLMNLKIGKNGYYHRFIADLLGNNKSDYIRHFPLISDLIGNINGKPASVLGILGECDLLLSYFLLIKNVKTAN